MIGLLDEFSRRAQALGATVRPIVRTGVGEAVAPDAGATASARAWLGGWPMRADWAMPDVVALGRLGVVETGSVLLVEPTFDRAACLLSEHLWILLPADQLVPGLPDALAVAGELARAGEAYLLVLSGPSRTGDIERALTIGVHGPAALTILLVREP